MFTLLVFLVVLGVIVFVHELGHFLCARWCKIKVEEFGFGFPPRLLGVQKTIAKKWKFIWGGKKEDATVAPAEQNTVYSLNWIPIGGFVRIKGEDPTITAAVDPDSFANKNVWQKSLVLAAGVLMNVVLAFVILTVGYIIGLPQANSNSGDLLPNSKLQIIQVVTGKPADFAGLQPGDTILKTGDLNNPRLLEFQNYVDANRGKEITLEIGRGQQILDKKITPILLSETGKGGIGVSIAEIGIVKYPWYRAIYHGLIATGIYLKEIFVAFLILIKGLFMGRGAGGVISGPVGVAVMTGQVARMGLSYLLQFAAMLSLNLAVLNILPIPALDGGRLLFIWAGKIFKNGIAPKIEQAAHSIGFVLLMVLILAVTVKDLAVFKSVFVNLFHRIF